MGFPLTIFLAALVFLFAVALPPGVAAFLRFRHARRVRCPRTGRPATIALDCWHAAVTAFPGPPRMHVERCSQWPAHHDCGEACVAPPRR